jgi:ABC-type sulfate transport system permease subunit
MDGPALGTAVCIGAHGVTRPTFRVLRVFRGLSHLSFSVSNVFSDFVFLLGFAVRFIPNDLGFIL